MTPRKILLLVLAWIFIFAPILTAVPGGIFFFVPLVMASFYYYDNVEQYFINRTSAAREHSDLLAVPPKRVKP
jgi:hypothetical protein